MNYEFFERKNDTLLSDRQTFLYTALVPSIYPSLSCFCYLAYTLAFITPAVLGHGNPLKTKAYFVLKED